MQSQTRVLTAHVPELLAAKVDEIAARLDRSRTWIIKQALSTWISEEEKCRQMTLEALADVDEGNVFDHHAIQNWINTVDKEE